jgi:hypothetical protein
MIIFLFFGLLTILLAFFLWFIVPCLYFCWIRPAMQRASGERGELNDNQVNKVLEGLKKTPFNP